jgi:hypothetical protein
MQYRGEKRRELSANFVKEKKRKEEKKRKNREVAARRLVQTLSTEVN